MQCRLRKPQNVVYQSNSIVITPSLPRRSPSNLCSFETWACRGRDLSIGTRNVSLLMLGSHNCSAPTIHFSSPFSSLSASLHILHFFPLTFYLSNHTMNAVFNHVDFPLRRKALSVDFFWARLHQ